MLRLLTPAGASTATPVVTTPDGNATVFSTFPATAGSSIAPTNGPPTTSTTFSYAGFGVHEAVDIYFDTTDVALSHASEAGDGSVTLTIPASATPGMHWVTAVGRHTGDSAQSAFLVRRTRHRKATTSGGGDTMPGDAELVAVPRG